MKKYKVVTICGSMKFFPRMLEVAERKTANDEMVLMPFVVKNAFNIHMTDVLDQLHLAKIATSDEVYVVNTDGYIGESTRREIDYALNIGIPVYYDQDLDDQ
jgi:hypothetical protein